MHSFTDMPVLVAGATGLVGANLARRLQVLGCDVTGSYHVRPPADVAHRMEQRDFEQFSDCLAATRGRDVVFLCATSTYGVKWMKEHPTGMLLPNLKIVAGLFEACAINRVPRVVLFSSSTVYPPSHQPVREEDLDLNVAPCSMYDNVGWLNRYWEQLARGYNATHGMKTLVLRVSSVYGPHDSCDPENSHVIPGLIMRALGKETPFVVWGGPDTVRDFLFVDDLVEDVVDLMRHDGYGQTFNMAHGRAITVGEVATKVLAAAGHDVAPRFDVAKPASIPYRAVSIARLTGFLGERRRTPMDTSLGKTIDWYRQHSSSRTS